MTTESSDLTLGQVRNRIDALISRGLYRPDMPLTVVLDRETFAALIEPKEKRK